MICFGFSVNGAGGLAWPGSSRPLWVVPHAVQKQGCTYLPNFTSLTVPASVRRTTNHVHSKTHTHTFEPLGHHDGETLTRSEADTCQQSPPYLPLAALTKSSSKAALAEGERRAFFSSSPKALLRDFFLGVHTPELSTAFNCLMTTLPQLLTQRAEPLSQLQSSYCPSSLEALALRCRPINSLTMTT